MQLPNVPYFPVIYQAVLRLGAVVVSMNTLLKAGEVAFHLDDAGCRLLVGWLGFSAEARGGCEQAVAECLVVEPGGFDSMFADSDPVTDVLSGPTAMRR